MKLVLTNTVQLAACLPPLRAGEAFLFMPWARRATDPAAPVVVMVYVGGQTLIYREAAAGG